MRRAVAQGDAAALALAGHLEGASEKIAQAEIEFAAVRAALEAQWPFGEGQPGRPGP